MTNRTCEKCNKYCTMEAALYCPFCGEAYKYCSMNLCECNKNIVSTEKCTTCGSEPVEFTRKEFDTYSNNLDEQYRKLKPQVDKLKVRIDNIWRKTTGRNCMDCTKWTICNSCYGPSWDDR